MGQHATEIVGYTFNADNYCPPCMYTIMMAGGTCDDSARIELVLDGLAASRGIVRSDESSFDSGVFPKVIFADMVSEDERCASCGVELVES